MKKYIILSLIATFVSIFSANAQDNTYSVVIQMAGGTTFTIGPNEVENITFKDGEVLVSGTSIQSIMDYLKLHSAQIAENQALAMDNSARIAATEKRIETDETAIAALVTRAEAYYNENLNNLKMLYDMINNSATREDLAAVMAEVNTIKEVLANLHITGTDVDLSNYYNKDEIVNLLANFVTKDQVDIVLQYVQAQLTAKYEEMQKNDEELKARVAYLSNEVVKNTEEIAMLREMIEQLRKEVTELSGK